MLAVLGVKVQAVFYDLQDLMLTVNPRQLFCQLRMPAKFAPQLNPVSLGAF